VYLRAWDEGQLAIGELHTVFEAETVLVASDEETRARWRALGRGHVARGTAHSLRGERVDMGREDVTSSLTSQIVVAPIVREDQKDVRFVASSLIGGRFPSSRLAGTSWVISIAGQQEEATTQESQDPQAPEAVVDPRAGVGSASDSELGRSLS